MTSGSASSNRSAAAGKRSRSTSVTCANCWQQVRRALGFAGDAMVLHEGSVAAHEEPGVLLDDPRLLNAYMGGSRPT